MLCGRSKCLRLLWIILKSVLIELITIYCHSEGCIDLLWFCSIWLCLLHIYLLLAYHELTHVSTLWVFAPSWDCTLAQPTAKYPPFSLEWLGSFWIFWTTLMFFLVLMWRNFFESVNDRIKTTKTDWIVNNSCYIYSFTSTIWFLKEIWVKGKHALHHNNYMIIYFWYIHEIVIEHFWTCIEEYISSGLKVYIGHTFNYCNYT